MKTPIPPQIISEVKEKAIKLFAILHEDPLVGIYGAIEVANSCNILIKKNNKYPITCLITCDEYSALTKRKDGPLNLRTKSLRHFIFCQKQETKEYEHFTIAHELSHIFLHWPLKKNVETWDVEVANGYDAYAVKFNYKQECQADVLGCIIITHLLDPVNNLPKKISHRKLMAKIKEYHNKNLLQSSRFEE